MMRDGPEDTAVSSIAIEVDVGQDSRGKQLTSLVMTAAESREAAAPRHDRKKWPRTLSAFFTSLTEALAAHGAPFQPEPGGLAVRAVESQMIRKRFYQIYDEGEADKDKIQDTLKKAFQRGFKEAQQREVAQIRRTETGAVMVWVPER
jgi:hypothetical protein